MPRITLNIDVSYDPPPIPDRRYDWRATFADYDGAEDSSTRSHIGWGRTREEAIQDLVENYGEDAA